MSQPTTAQDRTADMSADGIEPGAKARWLVQAEQTVTITFEVAAEDAGDRDALVAGYLALRRPSTGLDDIMGAFFGRLRPSSVSIVKTEPGGWRITSAEAAPDA